MARERVLMNKLTVNDIDVAGKRVLVRVDFNVPLDEKTGAITDDSRIQAVLATITYLTGHKAKVILMSHLGRPEGKVTAGLRLEVVAWRLAQVLGQKVGFVADCVGSEAEDAVARLATGEVLLLENLRFHPEEEAGDAGFAQALARLGDIFVNDAFGTSHRAHASVTGVPRYLPAVAGRLLEKELDTLGGIIESPARPFAALLGGAKVSDKIGMLENIIDKVDLLLIGGGMAATFLKAVSCETGLSLVEVERVGTAADLMAKGASNGVRLLLPVDAVVADGEIRDTARGKVVSVKAIAPRQRIVDIGPETVANFQTELKTCQTVFWNGPMGICEIPQFARGTQAMAEVLASLPGTTVIGGGSTAEAVIGLGLADRMTFVSTGGGASLEFLSGKPLPGVEVLLDKGSPAAPGLKKVPPSG